MNRDIMRRQRDAIDAEMLEILARACTETYMGADEGLLLMAKGRALDRLIAAWERLDHERAAGRAREGVRGDDARGAVELVRRVRAMEYEAKRYVGSSEAGEARVETWRNAGDEISIWIEEEYQQEGRPPAVASALCSLPRALAAELGRTLVALAEG